MNDYYEISSQISQIHNGYSYVTYVSYLNCSRSRCVNCCNTKVANSKVPMP